MIGPNRVRPKSAGKNPHHQHPADMDDFKPTVKSITRNPFSHFKIEKSTGSRKICALKFYNINLSGQGTEVF
jgi:hypothetical protein